VADRYQRWCKDGLWERIRQTLLASDAPLASSG
jgi:hypothetical protein